MEEENKQVNEITPEVVKNPKPSKKAKKEKQPVTALGVFSNLCFILGVIGLSCSLVTLCAPIIVGVLYIIFGIALVFISVFTLFLVWIKDENRAKVGEVNDFIQKISSNLVNIFHTTPYFFAGGMAFMAISLVLNLIGMKKYSITYKVRFIASCVFLGIGLTIIAVYLIFYFNNVYKG